MRCGGKSCYGLASACDAAVRRVVACYSSFLARPRRDGGGGSRPPSLRLGLALTRQCARLTGAVRLFCFPPHAPTNPKIDNGGKSIQGRCVSTTMPLGAVRGQVILRTRLRMRRRGTPRRRLLRLVPGSASPGWGRGVPTPLPLARPQANAAVGLFDRRSAVTQFTTHTPLR